MIATEEFVTLARDAARSQGLPSARIATVPHPIGGIEEEVLREHADTAVESVIALFTGRSPQSES